MSDEDRIAVMLTADQIAYVLAIMVKDRDEELRKKKDGYGRLVHFIWGIIDELEQKFHSKA